MRTASELGAIVKERRLALGRTQVQVVEAANAALGMPAISEPTYRALETGRTEASDLTLTAASRGLGWPADALSRVRQGESPPREAGPIEWSASEGPTSLDRLRAEHPDRWRRFEDMADEILRDLEGDAEAPA